MPAVSTVSQGLSITCHHLRPLEQKYCLSSLPSVWVCFVVVFVFHLLFGFTGAHVAFLVSLLSVYLWILYYDHGQLIFPDDVQDCIVLVFSFLYFSPFPPLNQGT